MSYTQEALSALSKIRSVKHSDLDQKELKLIYEKEKIKVGSIFKHPLIEPTYCPWCGNYRLDFGYKVYICPQARHCRDSWNDELRLNV